MARAAIAALLVAVALGTLWASLPAIVARAVASDGNSTGLGRLKVAYQMAGGRTDPQAASVNVADAIKALLVSRLFGSGVEAWARGVPTGARSAWQQLASTVRSAESTYLSPTMSFGLGPPEHAAGEIAEGLRYVSHVLRLALELYVERGPKFVRFASPGLKMLGDNPDAFYYIAPLDPARSYTVSGCRAGEVYWALSVHAAPEGSAFPRVAADLNDERLRLDGDGCYQVVLSAGLAEPANLPEGISWLQLPPNAESVVTRHYFEASPPAQLDRMLEARVAAALRIDERGSGVGGAAPLATDAEMAGRLSRADAFVRSLTNGNEAPDPTTAPPFFALLPNTVGPPQKWSRDAEGMGAVDIAYSGGRFLLREGEALLIRGVMPACRFANVVLWNRFLQTFDYERSRPVWLSRARMHLSPSGGFTIVLAAESPFRDAAHERQLNANWLSSEGRPSATIFFRFVLPEHDIVQPSTQVLPLTEALAAISPGA